MESALGSTIGELSGLLVDHAGPGDAVRRRQILSELAKHFAHELKAGRGDALEGSIEALPPRVRAGVRESLTDISLTVTGYFVGSRGPVTQRLILAGMPVRSLGAGVDPWLPKGELVDTLSSIDLGRDANVGVSPVVFDVLGLPCSLTGWWRWSRAFARALGGAPLKLEFTSERLISETSSAGCVCLVVDERTLGLYAEQPAEFWRHLASRIFSTDGVELGAPARLDKVLKFS
jgi:hypothetical protein